MTRRRRIGLALLLLAGAFALWEGITSIVAYTADAYVRSDLVAVAPQVTGRILTVHVLDNQTVAPGDPLVTIDPLPFQLIADQRRAEVDEAGAQIAADQDTIAAARDAISAAESAVAYASETQRRLAVLASSQDVSRQELDRTNDALRRATADADAARADLARKQATAAMHLAARARATAALATAEWQLGRTRVVSPTSGTVNNLTVRAGDTAQADVPLIGIVDAHAWRIVANFPQSYLRGFTARARAWVWLDSQPWHVHRARITGIARGISRDPTPDRLLPYVAPTTDWIRLQRRFPVTLELVDRPADLTLFMGADARVLILP